MKIFALMPECHSKMTWPELCRLKWKNEGKRSLQLWECDVYATCCCKNQILGSFICYFHMCICGWAVITSFTLHPVQSLQNTCTAKLRALCHISLFSGEMCKLFMLQSSIFSQWLIWILPAGVCIVKDCTIILQDKWWVCTVTLE